MSDSDSDTDNQPPRRTGPLLGYMEARVLDNFTREFAGLVSRFSAAQQEAHLQEQAEPQRPVVRPLEPDTELLPLEDDFDVNFYEEDIDEPALRPVVQGNVAFSSFDIYSSCKAGLLDRVRYLVEVEEVDVNRKDNMDSVPIFYACLCGHAHVVRYLLNHGAVLREGTFEATRCYYGALTHDIRRILDSYKASRERHDGLLASFRKLCPTLQPASSSFASSSSSSSSLGSFGIELALSLDEGPAPSLSTLPPSSNKFFDFTFIAEGRPLAVHSWMIAACCPFLNTEIRKSRYWKARTISFGAKSGILAVPLAHLVRYWYTGKMQVPIVSKSLEGILRICKRLRLPRLSATLLTEAVAAAERGVEQIVLQDDPPAVAVRQALRKVYSELPQSSSTSFTASPASSWQPPWRFDTELAVLSGSLSGEPRVVVYIPCHRALLAARSAFFNTLLTSNFQEGASEELKTLNFHPCPIAAPPMGENEDDFTVTVARAFLCWVYTDSLGIRTQDRSKESVAQIAVAVMNLAEMHMQVDLSAAANQVVCQCVTLHNVWSVFNLAITRRSHKLETACIEFLRRTGVADVIRSEAFQQFVQEDEEAAVEIQRVLSQELPAVHRAVEQAHNDVNSLS